MFYLQSFHPSKYTIFTPSLTQIDWATHNFWLKMDISCKFFKIMFHKSQHIRQKDGFSCTMATSFGYEPVFPPWFKIYFFICVCKCFRRMFQALCPRSFIFIGSRVWCISICLFFKSIRFQIFRKFGQCYSKLIALCSDSSSSVYSVSWEFSKFFET